MVLAVREGTEGQQWERNLDARLETREGVCLGCLAGVTDHTPSRVPQLSKGSSSYLLEEDARGEVGHASRRDDDARQQLPDAVVREALEDGVLLHHQHPRGVLRVHDGSAHARAKGAQSAPGWEGRPWPACTLGNEMDSPEDQLWVARDGVGLTPTVHHGSTRLLDEQAAGHEPAGGAGEAQAGARSTEQCSGVCARG
jgi:hypothetical protein